MPVIQNSVSVTASSIVDNILTSSQFEFLPYDAYLEFGLVGDVNAADLRLDVYSGQDVLAENMQPSAANRIPIFPDDFTLTDVAGAGERIKVRVRNTSSSGPRMINYAIRITPV